ncbi:Ctr domain-containing protein [Cephalotus follicularis]|uniref:Copper transport protein n=1 Tax=Cephalotus follicularis TaxID=3775 RepID=A0A1Q3BYJ9_CEPFO|nr:Ctr domain-containing protein [Cephalotus follicularis]
MDHGHDMPGMAHMMPPTSSPPPMMIHHKMMMHMTFFWGKNTEVLFSGWPGTSSGMYALALVFVFAIAFMVEWLSHYRFLERDDDTNHVLAGFVQTLLHCLRVGLSYLVMLAVMSFNGGVFLVAVAGHSLGFLCFGSRVFKKSPLHAKTSRLPPMSC